MHDQYVLTKKIFLPLKLWQYTEVLTVAQYVLSLYTLAVYYELPYVSEVSVPAKKSQYIYIHN